MSKTLKWILISLVALVVLLIAGKMIFGNKQDGLKVTTEAVAQRTIVETVVASGKIYPEIEVKISPDISGEITELNVVEGDSVTKGDVLARIYADIYATQRDQAAADVSRQQAMVANSNANLVGLKATMDQAKANYDRQKELLNQKVISQAEFEQAQSSYLSSQASYDAAKKSIESNQASVKSAQASLSRANKDLNRTTLVAPMSGIISSLTVKEGERVAGNSFNVGTEMMRVADMSSLEVRVDVGENDIVKVSIGDSADITVDAYDNRKFKGVVYQIAASTAGLGSLSAATTSNDVTNYEVKVRIDPASYADLLDPKKPRKLPFRPGMNASTEIKTRRKDNVLSVPINSVAARVKGSDKSVEDQKKDEEKKEAAAAQGSDNTAAREMRDANQLEEVVFVVQPDNTVKKVVVTTGIQDINYIEITSGLKAGEKVVSGPYNAVAKTLKSGDKINETTQDKLFATK